jgi:hypothetical protein
MSLTLLVPPPVPSLIQSSIPVVPSLAEKKSAPLTLASAFGKLLAAPGFMSLTIAVWPSAWPIAKKTRNKRVKGPNLDLMAQLLILWKGLYSEAREAIWTVMNMPKKLRRVNGNLKKSIACVTGSPI